MRHRYVLSTVNTQYVNKYFNQPQSQENASKVFIIVLVFHYTNEARAERAQSNNVCHSPTNGAIRLNHLVRNRPVHSYYIFNNARCKQVFEHWKRRNYNLFSIMLISYGWHCFYDIFGTKVGYTCLSQRWL